MIPVDLFGADIADPKPRFARTGKRKKDYTPKGYSAQPGTGPKGEVCKGCKHFVRLGYHDKTYFKCLLSAKKTPLPPAQAIKSAPRVRYHLSWSHCHTSDIRANSPACKNFTAPDLVEWVPENTR